MKTSSRPRAATPPSPASPSWGRHRLAWTAAAAAACSLTIGCSTASEGGEDTPSPDASPEAREIDDRPAVLAAIVPPPIMGGGLHLTADGAWAVIADADRDVIHLVDLADDVETHTIRLEPGSLPWRMAEDAAGLVHVTARGTGEVVTIDPSQGSLVSRTQVCPNPRGIAMVDDESWTVACAGGDIATLTADGVVHSQFAGRADLRDVLPFSDGPWVTHFRSAQVSPIADPSTGSVGPQPTTALFEDGEATLVPTTAWRTRLVGEDRWLMLHQTASTRPIELPTGDSDGGDSDGGSDRGSEDGGGTGGGGSDSAYGGSGFDPCSGPVQAVVSHGDRNGDVRSSGGITLAVLAVDVAVSPQQDLVALAVPGRAEFHELGLLLLDWDAIGDGQTCTGVSVTPPIEGQMVAVEFDADGMLYAFSRQPAALVRFDPVTSEASTISLAGETRQDTGHDLFHLDAGAGLSCASCHPEGTDDGRVWEFIPGGRRHTPALNVGLAGTEPFHWAGEFADMTTLIDDVHGSRMGARLQSEPRHAAFERWVLGLATPPPIRTFDDAAQRGAQVFEGLGCATCHTGAALTSPASVDIGFDVALQVPPLLGIAHHPPYMHDGRAETLEAAVQDMVERTRPGAGATAEEIADVVAYLETL
jgi:mono/diheme cytochrome c family protein